MIQLTDNNCFSEFVTHVILGTGVMLWSAMACRPNIRIQYTTKVKIRRSQRKLGETEPKLSNSQDYYSRFLQQFG